MKKSWPNPPLWGSEGSVEGKRVKTGKIKRGTGLNFPIKTRPSFSSICSKSKLSIGEQGLSGDGRKTRRVSSRRGKVRTATGPVRKAQILKREKRG